MSTRVERFEAWKAANPDIDPEIYFAMKVGTPVTDRCEENISAGFVNLQDMGFDRGVEYIHAVYHRLADKRDTTVAEMLEHLVPDWAK